MGRALVGATGGNELQRAEVEAGRANMAACYAIKTGC